MQAAKSRSGRNRFFIGGAACGGHQSLPGKALVWMSSAAQTRMESRSATRSTGATRPCRRPDAMTAGMSGSGHSTAALGAAAGGAGFIAGSSSKLQSCTGLKSGRPGGLRMQPFLLKGLPNHRMMCYSTAMLHAIVSATPKAVSQSHRRT